MKNYQPTIATPEMREKVIKYFKSHKDNRSKIIAEVFGIKAYVVNAILDNHFKTFVK